jgi:hypothetical protein
MLTTTDPEQGTSYHMLRVACPECHCAGRSVQVTDWVHDRDGGVILIGDDATFQCNRCHLRDRVSAWSRQTCPVCSGANRSDQSVLPEIPSETNVGRMLLSRLGEDRGGRNVFVELSLSDLVALAGQMVMVTGNQWLIRFLENIGGF